MNKVDWSKPLKIEGYVEAAVLNSTPITDLKELVAAGVVKCDSTVSDNETRLVRLTNAIGDTFVRSYYEDGTYYKWADSLRATNDTTEITYRTARWEDSRLVLGGIKATEAEHASGTYRYLIGDDWAGFAKITHEDGKFVSAVMV